MSVFPTINGWECDTEWNRKLLLDQLQGLSEFSNQLTDGWLSNTDVLLMKRHSSQTL